MKLKGLRVLSVPYIRSSLYLSEYYTSTILRCSSPGELFMLPNNICYLICQDDEWAREKDVDLLVPEHPGHSFKYYLGKHLKSRNIASMLCTAHFQLSLAPAK